ncbi:MAG: hypothetical protein ACREEM_21965 [Blastocatellia bacterium]
MRERTNREKPLLGQTIECIGLMHKSLRSLYEREFPVNPMMFAIMAEGPVDQIRDLLDDLDWIMEDMIPQHLREDAAKLREAEETEVVTLEEAA